MKERNHQKNKKLNSQVVGLESYVRGALWSMIITYTGYVVVGGRGREISRSRQVAFRPYRMSADIHTGHRLTSADQAVSVKSETPNMESVEMRPDREDAQRRMHTKKKKKKREK